MSDINQINSGQPATSSTTKRSGALNQEGGNTASDAAKARANTPSTADKLTVTEQALKLQALERELSELPAEDAERIESLRNEIAAGGYQADSERIAEKLIALEKELI